MFIFLSGQALRPPPPPLIGRATKIELFVASLITHVTKIGPITGRKRVVQHEGGVHTGAKEHCRKERNHRHCKPETILARKKD